MNLYTFRGFGGVEGEGKRTILELKAGPIYNFACPKLVPQSPAPGLLLGLLQLDRNADGIYLRKIVSAEKLSSRHDLLVICSHHRDIRITHSPPPHISQESFIGVSQVLKVLLLSSFIRMRQHGTPPVGLHQGPYTQLLQGRHNTHVVDVPLKLGKVTHHDVFLIVLLVSLTVDLFKSSFLFGVVLSFF